MLRLLKAPSLMTKFLPACLLLLLSLSLQAELRVEVDRTSVRVNESLNMLITSDQGSVEQIDLSQLPPELEVIARSTRQNVQIINGRRSANYELSLTLIAVATGEVSIPALQARGDSSQPVSISIAPEASGANKVVELTLESALQQAYVFQEVPLTLRLRLAGDLTQGELSDLDIPQAHIELINEQRYRQGSGEVIERNYVLYPQSVGSLNIPSLRFQGSLRANSRLGLSGGVVRSSSSEFSIEVLPPAVGELAQWLPASSVRLTEELQPVSSQIALGQPITRRITLEAVGALGEKLPAIDLAPIANDDLRQYRDQSQYNNTKSRSSMVGQRVENIVYIPQNLGTAQLPEIVVPWWDVNSGQLAYASLPARQLQIVANPNASLTADPTSVPAAVADAEPQATVASTPDTGDSAIGSPISVQSNILYLLAGLLLFSLLINLWLAISWWRRRPVAPASSGHNISQSYYQDLRQAIDAGDNSQISLIWRRWQRHWQRQQRDWREHLRAEEAQQLEEIMAVIEHSAWGRPANSSAKPNLASLLKLCSKLERNSSKPGKTHKPDRARHLRPLYNN